MGKSKLDTGSTLSAGEAESATTVARSKPSRKSAKKPTTKGHGLSDSDLLNILMVDLNRVQERFGEIHLLRAPGDEPAMFVLPKKLDVCANEICGMIIPRTGNISYCEAHGIKPDSPQG